MVLMKVAETARWDLAKILKLVGLECIRKYIDDDISA
jgi:hypothetical protein